MTKIKVGDDVVTLRVDEKPDIQVSAFDGEGMPYARLSVRLEVLPEPGCFWLKDWSENTEIVAAMIQAGVITLTGRLQQTGHVFAKEARVATEPKSQVRINAEKDPDYCPYCMRCRGLVRMVKVEPFYWRCNCGAEHDERGS